MLVKLFEITWHYIISLVVLAMIRYVFLIIMVLYHLCLILKGSRVEGGSKQTKSDKGLKN